jgi:glycosyltransferase involved in cell wall biosynthesis
MIKGYDALAMAWSELASRFPVRLVIAGTMGHDFGTYPEISRDAYAAPDFPSIAARFRADSRVVLGPQLREALLRRTYWEADIYVHLARMETFGYSILEAMAHALPVVATNIRAIPEMVVHEETGYLVDVHGIDINSRAWPEHVSQNVVNYLCVLIENAELRTQMGLAGRKRVSEAFSVQYRSDVLRQVYAGVQRERLEVTEANLAPVR